MIQTCLTIAFIGLAISTKKLLRVVEVYDKGYEVELHLNLSLPSSKTLLLWARLGSALSNRDRDGNRAMEENLSPKPLSDREREENVLPIHVVFSPKVLINGVSIDLIGHQLVCHFRPLFFLTFLAEDQRNSFVQSLILILKEKKEGKERGGGSGWRDCTLACWRAPCPFSSRIHKNVVRILR